jgi:hypothetical protein
MSYPGVQEASTVDVTTTNVEEPPEMPDVETSMDEIVDGVPVAVRPAPCSGVARAAVL